MFAQTLHKHVAMGSEPTSTGRCSSKSMILRRHGSFLFLDDGRNDHQPKNCSKQPESKKAIPSTRRQRRDARTRSRRTFGRLTVPALCRYSAPGGHRLTGANRVAGWVPTLRLAGKVRADGTVPRLRPEARRRAPVTIATEDRNVHPPLVHFGPDRDRPYVSAGLYIHRSVRGGGGSGSGKSGIMRRRNRRTGGVRYWPRRVNTP